MAPPPTNLGNGSLALQHNYIKVTAVTTINRSHDMEPSTAPSVFCSTKSRGEKKAAATRSSKSKSSNSENNQPVMIAVLQAPASVGCRGSFIGRHQEGIQLLILTITLHKLRVTACMTMLWPRQWPINTLNMAVSGRHTSETQKDKMIAAESYTAPDNGSPTGKRTHLHNSLYKDITVMAKSTEPELKFPISPDAQWKQSVDSVVYPVGNQISNTCNHLVRSNRAPTDKQSETNALVSSVIKCNQPVDNVVFPKVNQKSNAPNEQ